MTCGPGKWGNRIVPDQPLGVVDFMECCAYHDYGYARPGGRSRKEVDAEFLQCMEGTAKKAKRPRLAKALAHIYYRAVRWGGDRSWGTSARA